MARTHRSAGSTLVAAAVTAALTSPAISQDFPLGAPSPLTYSVRQARDPLPGDFTGDGHVDFLIASSSTLGLSLLPADGAGEFGPARRAGGDSGIVSTYATGDLDGDGDLDAVALVSPDPGENSTLVRLINDGAGNFVTEHLRDGIGDHGQLNLSDLTGDGVLDIVLDLTNGAGFTIVYFPSVVGGYGAQVIAFPAVSGNSYSIADVDSDGIQDLVARNPFFELQYARGLGAGAFAAGATISAPGGGAIEYPGMFSDIDGDGTTDYVQLTGNDVRYYLGQGGTSFAAPVRFGTTFGTLTNDGLTMLLDIDGDGDLDAIVVELFGPPPFFNFEYVVYPQTAPGVFGAGVALGINLPSPVIAVDVNGDGIDDLAWERGAPDRLLSWRIGNGQAGGGFYGPENGVEQLPLALPFAPFTADLDQDGDDDIVFSTGPQAEVRWLENLGTGSMGSPRALISPTEIGFLTSVVDVDGDSDLDLVLMRDHSFEFWLNDGSEQFTLSPPQPISPSGTLRQFVAEDLDDDGDVDVLVARDAAANGAVEAWLYENDGAGNFSTTLVLDLSEQAFGVSVGELNGDTNRDLVTARSAGVPGSYSINVYLGSGSSTFAPPIQASGSHGARLIEVADLDLDGLDDALVHDPATGIVYWRSLGGGAIDQPTTLVEAPTVVDFLPVEVIDFDSDGDQDLIYRANQEFSSPQLYLVAEQDASGQFRDGYPLVQAVGGIVRVPFSTVDLDGDGDREVIGTDTRDVIAYENFGIVHLGTAICAAPVTESGPLAAVGSDALGDNSLTLIGAWAPANVFGMAVGSRTVGAPTPVANSQGSLCLTGAIGRYDGPNQIMNSGPGGLFRLDLDLGALEIPGGPIPAQVGESWSFQIWHRSPVSGSGPPSRFTTGVSVQLR